MKYNFRFDVKQMRYIGKNNFTTGVRLNIGFDDIFESTHYFRRVVALDDKQEIYDVGKPRFNSLCLDSHCEMPILSKDYYLIGFTDNLNGGAKYYKFLFEACTNEYMKKEDDISKYESFEPKCEILERL